MNVAYNLHRLFWVAADWLYPPACSGCGRNGERFCSDCLAQVTVITGSLCALCGKPTADGSSVCPHCSGDNIFFESAVSWAVYGGVLREAIHALKYRQDMGLGDFFSTYLITILTTHKWNFDIVLPVPISRDRMKERGFNQSELLSKPIALYFQVAHSSNALVRTKDTGTQIHHTKTERDTYLIDAFSANPAKLNGMKVLLVDDIITTGSTINHCAKALKAAGASQVNVVSIAKTLRREKR